MKTRMAFTAVATTLVLASVVQATVVVNSFQPIAGPTTTGVWYLTDMRGAGTATIPDLTGAGGNLENNQPLPTGAARLTTGASTGDKAEVGLVGTIGNDYGSAATALTSGTFGYSYYKQSVGQSAPAPSLKLSLFAPGGTGDNFGTLIYEPYWNQGGGGATDPPADAWQTVAISSTTGTGGDGGEGWWWNGGFGEANSFGGPPIKSLAEWAALFAADPDFANARVVGVQVGVGTFNTDQVGYFDNVSIAIPGGLNETYDFQAIPEASQIVLGLATSGIAGLAWLRRRATKA